jgi:hypothetical protein
MESDVSANDEMIYLAVPKGLYDDVIGLIAAERLGMVLPSANLAGHARSAAQPGAAPTPVGTPQAPAAARGPSGELTLPGDADRLRRIYTEANPQIQRLLRFLAAHEGEWLTYAELSDELGYDNPRQLPGLLSPFSRRLTNRHNGWWPFKANDEVGVWRAMMTPEAADIIGEL